ncbi:MAG: Gfo/Idh/MocA family protein [Planctomycetota bacterium]
MPQRTSRRQFLGTSAAVGVGFWVAGGVQAQQSKSPNERIAMASVGIGGKGSSDSADADRRGDMVAICDADEKRLNQAGEKKFQKAKRFTDFRKMLEEMEGSIDAVTVSTPDHCHAPASLMAMRMGKHCFCQKPLTRTVYEARLMGEVAREKGLATQMGNQGTASNDLRRAAAWLKAGVLGRVREVHVWTNRPIWPQGGPRPEPEPCPDNLNWDLWLGPAPERPYGKGYHPFSWRGWWDFGTGALGDMACHEINMAFMGLDLRNPISIQAETSGHNKDSFPKWSIVTYEFPAISWRPELKLIWYDGGKKPPQDLCGDKVPGKEGKLVIGDKGKLWGYGELMGGAEPVDVEYPKSPGHFDEWTRAIQGGEPAVSNFPDYAGPLAEVVLCGNLAVWVASEGGLGQKVEWDSTNMKVNNIDGLETFIKPEYREGYTLDA